MGRDFDAGRRQKEAAFCAYFPEIEPEMVMNAVGVLNRSGETATVESVRAYLAEDAAA